jgi:hypothetical protein
MAEIVMPFVHLNGTSAEELCNLREMAYAALDDAADALRRMSPNARDYYLVAGRMELAEEQHMRRIKAIRDIMAELEAECKHIMEFKRS